MVNIGIIGYGKLGNKIADLIKMDDNLHLGLTITSKNKEEFTQENIQRQDVIIELSGPEHAYSNLKALSQWGVPIVCGSTGWTERLEEIEDIFESQNTAFLYASNFSLGMNILFEINQNLAKLMGPFPFEAKISETHHVHKKDSPSGTSISLASDLIEQHPKYKTWSLDNYDKEDTLEIEAIREGETKGDHHVRYDGKYESLQISHEAYDRAVFAEGAILAARWIIGKMGIFRMRDVIGLA